MLYIYYIKLKSISSYNCIKAKRLYLMNILSNNYFPIINVTELANGAVEEDKKEWDALDKVPSKEKVERSVDSDALLVSTDKRPLLAIGNKKLPSIVGDTKSSPIIRIKELLLVRMNKKPLPVIKNKESSLKTVNVKLPPIVDKSPP